MHYSYPEFRILPTHVEVSYTHPNTTSALSQGQHYSNAPRMENRELDTMLPTTKSQHDYSQSSEGTAIPLKINHLEPPFDWHIYMSNVHHKLRAMEIEYNHRQNLLFLEHIMNLPYELRAMVMDKYFEDILLPGEVEPIPCDTHPGSDCFLYDKSSFWCETALRTMSSKIHNRYQQRYWSENTVVSR